MHIKENNKNYNESEKTETTIEQSLREIKTQKNKRVKVSVSCHTSKHNENWYTRNRNTITTTKIKNCKNRASGRRHRTIIEQK